MSLHPMHEAVEEDRGLDVELTDSTVAVRRMQDECARDQGGTDFDWVDPLEAEEPGGIPETPILDEIEDAGIPFPPYSQFDDDGPMGYSMGEYMPRRWEVDRYPKVY